MNAPEIEDELIQDYLAECREHLATIESDLLAIERAGAHIDEQLVNRVFRAAHSIKGGAGFFALTNIKELAHKTENVLDLIRSREMTPTPGVVSVLLLAFDKLRELIDKYQESNQAPIGEFLSALTGLTRDDVPADHNPSVAGQICIEIPSAKRRVEIPAFHFNEACKGSKFLYFIQYDLIQDLQLQNKNPLDFFRKLIRCGAILHGSLDMESAGTLDDDSPGKLVFEILYATVIEPDLIR